MTRHPNANRRQPCCRYQRNRRLFGNNYRQRPGEKMFDELFGHARNTARKQCDVSDVCDVGDKRVIGRTFLRDKNFSQCLFVEYIRAEAVNRFGRKCDNFSFRR